MRKVSVNSPLTIVSGNPFSNSYHENQYVSSTHSHSLLCTGDVLDSLSCGNE